MLPDSQTPRCADAGAERVHGRLNARTTAGLSRCRYDGSRMTIFTQP